MPLTASRSQLPHVRSMPRRRRRPTGRLDDLPVAGIALGHVPPAPGAPWPKLTSFPTMADLSAALGQPLQSRQLLLNPDQPLGYVRDWHPTGLGAGAPSVLCDPMVGVRRTGTGPVWLYELAPGRAMNPPLAATRPKRGVLLLLALLFFAPLLLAFLIYYGSGWRPTGHTNHGELILPARSLLPRCPNSSAAGLHWLAPPALAVARAGRGCGRCARRRADVMFSAASGRWCTSAAVTAMPTAATRSISCARRISGSPI
jgi:hypothetical protein